MQKLHEFLYVCKELESNRLKNVEGIVADYIDPASEIVPGCKLFKLLQKFETKDEKRYLLGLLTGRPNIPEKEKSECIMNGKRMWIWSKVLENMMVSLCSDALFEDCKVPVEIEEKKEIVRNISKNIHIDYYAEELGKRFFVANDEKHKKDRENPYGKGKIASPMDLEQDEAQELLDKAIIVNGRLYGRKNGVNYAFQNTRKTEYHGYIADDLPDNIKHELDKYDW